MRPVDMLSLYRENIEIYAKNPNNDGVDALIESYAGKYHKNKTLLTRTVAFFDRLESDLDFRTKIITDRGFLFEHFYVNPDIDQPLYNKLRRDPAFTDALVEDMSPIQDLITPYRSQLNAYPSEIPQDYFKGQLSKALEADDIIAETRMLMGLYRLNVQIVPKKPYDTQFSSSSLPVPFST